MSLDGYVYPDWTEALGGLLAMSSALVLSGFAIYEIYHATGSTLREVC